MLSLLFEYFRLCQLCPGESFFFPYADFSCFPDAVVLISQWLPATHSARIFDCQHLTSTIYLMGQATNSIIYLINHALLGNFFQYWLCCVMLSNCGTDRLLYNKRSTQLPTIETKIPQDLSYLNQAVRKQKSVLYSTCEAEVATTTNTAQSVQFIHNVLSSGG